VPRIELPSMSGDGETHNWVDYRDVLKASDRFEVQKVARLEMKEEANLASFLEMQNDMRNALLARIIEAWSYPVPIPKENSFSAADRIIGDLMDLDDYSVLEQAVEPLMDKISGRITRNPKATGSS
jgi:hypothetical protein